MEDIQETRLTPVELQSWIEKRTAESSAESNLHLWDWQVMRHLKAERDRMCERLTAAEESKIRLQWDLDTANARNEMDELAEELTALKAPPDVECWKRLVTIAYAEGGDGALQIERITAEYNRAKAECARLARSAGRFVRKQYVCASVSSVTRDE